MVTDERPMTAEEMQRRAIMSFRTQMNEQPMSEWERKIAAFFLRWGATERDRLVADIDRCDEALALAKRVLELPCECGVTACEKARSEASAAIAALEERRNTHERE